MPGKSDDPLERCLINAIRQVGGEAGQVGIDTDDVVSKVIDELSVPAVDIRGAIWRLVDSRKVEFTESRRLKLAS